LEAAIQSLVEVDRYFNNTSPNYSIVLQATTPETGSATPCLASGITVLLDRMSGDSALKSELLEQLIKTSVLSPVIEEIPPQQQPVVSKTSVLSPVIEEIPPQQQPVVSEKKQEKKTKSEKKAAAKQKKEQQTTKTIEQVDNMSAGGKKKKEDEEENKQQNNQDDMRTVDVIILNDTTEDNNSSNQQQNNYLETIEKICKRKLTLNEKKTIEEAFAQSQKKTDATIIILDSSNDETTLPLAGLRNTPVDLSAASVLQQALATSSPATNLNISLAAYLGENDDEESLAKKLSLEEFIVNSRKVAWTDKHNAKQASDEVVSAVLYRIGQILDGQQQTGAALEPGMFYEAAVNLRPPRASGTPVPFATDSFINHSHNHNNKDNNKAAFEGYRVTHNSTGGNTSAAAAAAAGTYPDVLDLSYISLERAQERQNAANRFAGGIKALDSPNPFWGNRNPQPATVHKMMPLSEG